MGNGFGQFRNAFGEVDKVEYFGGATFIIDENSKRESDGSRAGMSMGSFMQIWIDYEIQDNGDF